MHANTHFFTLAFALHFFGSPPLIFFLCSLPDTNLSLDEFVAKYTSEDNASFNDIIDQARERLRSRYRWVYEQVIDR